MRVALASLVLVGCGPNYLQGSLTELISLPYTKVNVTSQPVYVPNPGQVAVLFITAQGQSEDIQLQVTASLDGTTFQANQNIDLAELTPGGVQRGVISRNVLNDPLKTFPALQRGELSLSAPALENTKVSGSFSATFVDGTDFGDGRTVFGTFTGAVP